MAALVPDKDCCVSTIGMKKKLLLAKQPIFLLGQVLPSIVVFTSDGALLGLPNPKPTLDQQNLTPNYPEPGPTLTFFALIFLSFILFPKLNIVRSKNVDDPNQNSKILRRDKEKLRK